MVQHCHSLGHQCYGRLTRFVAGASGQKTFQDMIVRVILLSAFFDYAGTDMMVSRIHVCGQLTTLQLGPTSHNATKEVAAGVRRFTSDIRLV